MQEKSSGAVIRPQVDHWDAKIIKNMLNLFFTANDATASRNNGIHCSRTTKIHTPRDKLIQKT